MGRESIDTSLQLEVNKGKEISEKVIIFYFFMLGGTCNIGWNATLNSLDFFKATFPDYNPSFIFPLAIYSAQLFSIFFITKLSTMFSYQVRILLCLITNGFIMLLISLESQLFANSLFGMCWIMFTLFIHGFANNLCYASVTGFTSKIEPRFIVYTLIGVSFFGLVASALKAVVLWIFDPSSDDDLASAFVYYLIITFIFGGTLALHIMFMRSEFLRVRSLPQDEQPTTIANTESRLVDEDASSLIIHPKRDFATLYVVFKEIKYFLVLMFTLYIQMDLPYPGVMLKKPMPSMAEHTKTVSLMLTFAFFLVAGKKLAQYREYYSKFVVIAVILCRFIFVVFFILQAVTLSIPILNTEWFAYVNVGLFGLTMGFSSVSLFILGAEQVKGENKEVSGFLTVFTINIGAILGGTFSLLLKDIGPPQ